MASSESKERRKIQRRAITANIGIATVVIAAGGLSGDTLQLYATDVLQLSPQSISFALGLLLLTVPIQIFGITLAHRFGYRRLMQLGYGGIALGLAAFWSLPTLFGYDRLLGYSAFVALVMLIGCLHAGSWGVAWLPWMRKITTVEDRGTFLSRMRSSVNLFNAIALWLFSFLVGATVLAWQYNLFITILIGYLLFAIFQISRIPEPEDEVRLQPTNSDTESTGRTSALSLYRRLRSELATLATQRDFLKLVSITVVVAFTLIPLFALYAVTILGFTAEEVARLLGLRAFAIIASLMLLGRLIDRLGYRSAIVWSSLGLAGITPLWFLVPVEPTGDPSVISWRFAMVAIIIMVNSGLNNLLTVALMTALSSVVDDARSVTAFTSFNILSATVFPRLIIVLAGVAISAAQGVQPVSLGFLHLDLYKGFLAIGMATGLIAAWLGRSLPGPHDV